MLYQNVKIVGLRPDFNTEGIAQGHAGVLPEGLLKDRAGIRKIDEGCLMRLDLNEFPLFDLMLKHDVNLLPFFAQQQIKHL